MQGASAQVEAIEQDVAGDQDGDEPEPDGFHVSSPSGALGQFALHEEEEEHAQQRVEAHEAQQGEERVAAGDARRVAVGGAHEAIDQPGLAAQFRRHPAGGVGDEGEREAEQRAHSMRR